MSNFYQIEKAAKKLEMSTKLEENFEVVISGNQNYESKWDKDKNESVYFLKDNYDFKLDLSCNDGERIGAVTVKLPGLEIELGNGWLSANTDYGWKTYIEYDSPKIWKNNVLDNNA